MSVFFSSEIDVLASGSFYLRTKLKDSLCNAWWWYEWMRVWDARSKCFRFKVSEFRSYTTLGQDIAQSTYKLENNLKKEITNFLGWIQWSENIHAVCMYHFASSSFLIVHWLLPTLASRFLSFSLKKNESTIFFASQWNTPFDNFFDVVKESLHSNENCK